MSGINAELINQAIAHDYIPVISPIGCDEMGQVYNINADSAAGSIAASLKADTNPLISKQLQEHTVLQASIYNVYAVYPAANSLYKDTMEVAQMGLVGRINQEIVAMIQKLGGKAMGISGVDGGTITAHKKEMVVDGERMTPFFL